MPKSDLIAAIEPEISAIRRDFHRHPELLYDVQRTAGIVADKLKEFGVDEVVTGIGRTGVVGVIRGRNAGAARSSACAPTWTRCRSTRTSGAPCLDRAGQDARLRP
jgi:hypothetical protein